MGQLINRHSLGCLGKTTEGYPIKHQLLDIPNRFWRHRRRSESGSDGRDSQLSVYCFFSTLSYALQTIHNMLCASRKMEYTLNFTFNLP